MSRQVVRKVSHLRKRVDRFLSSSTYGRDDVAAFVRKLGMLGPVVLFGGILRDLSILGNEGFHSDVDLVIDTDSEQSIEKFLAPYAYQRNKFGGYRIQLGRWKLDLWRFKTTWAISKGLVEGGTFADLCRTTFFDWDGIIYEIEGGRIKSVDGYIDRINRRVLSINLKENPNPAGNVVRAFRYCEKYDAQLSPELVRYINEFVGHLTGSGICAYEKNAHERPVLSENVASQIITLLKAHEERYPLLPFSFAEYNSSEWSPFATNIRLV